jgi:hypothetical protein
LELRTISASSLQSFEECPRRWHEENVKRTPRSGGTAPADLGTACHEALENYVGAVYKDKKREPSFDLLMMFYKVGFQSAFGSADFDRPEYKDGEAMLRRWFDRTDLSNVEIISMEKKDFIEIKTSAGIKKYNYIWDRCDRFMEHGKKIIRVVDYKTIRANITPDELRTKIQARMYGMAAAIQFKDEQPDEIWVQFDLLRYGTVDVKFSREQNVMTWKYIKSTAERIIGMDENTAPEQLGPGCQWCVRKATCKTLRKNVNGGGTYALLGGEDLLKARVEMEAVQKAAKYALEEIDNIIMAQARNEDMTEWETDNYEVKFTSSKRRVVDSHEAGLILGPQVMAQMGKLSISDVDKLLKGDELSPNQKSLLRGAIRENYSDPKPKVVKKTGL